LCFSKDPRQIQEAIWGMYLTTASVTVSALVAFNSGNLDVYHAQYAVSLVTTPPWLFITGRDLLWVIRSRLRTRTFDWKDRQLLAVGVFLPWLALLIETLVPPTAGTARRFSQPSCLKFDTDDTPPAIQYLWGLLLAPLTDPVSLGVCLIPCVSGWMILHFVYLQDIAKKFRDRTQGNHSMSLRLLRVEIMLWCVDHDLTPRRLY
jgi:hypothetical protein